MKKTSIKAEKQLPFVASELKAKADLFAQRAAVYGDNYKFFGQAMMGLFPRGLHCTTEEEFARLGIFIMLASKLSRYAQNFNRGGHEDSLDDTSVYAMMLKEIDTMFEEKRAMQDNGNVNEQLRRKK